MRGIVLGWCIAALMLALAGCGGGNGDDDGGNDIVNPPVGSVSGIDGEGYGAMSIAVTWPQQNPEVTHVAVSVHDGLTTQSQEATRSTGAVAVIFEFPKVAAGHPAFTVTATNGNSTIAEVNGALRVQAGRTTRVPVKMGVTPTRLAFFPRIIIVSPGASFTPRVTPFDEEGTAVMLPPGSITLSVRDNLRLNSDGSVTVLGGGHTAVDAYVNEYNLFDYGEVSAVNPIPGATGTIAFHSIADDYECFNEDIYIVKADGTGLRRLTSNHATDIDPALSPDGTMIAFRSDRANPAAERLDLYIMNTDGTGLRRLTNTGVDEAHFLADGRILYWKGDAAVIIRPDDSDQRPFPLPTVGISMKYPEVTPDGMRVVFYTEGEGGPPSGRVYIVKTDGSDLIPLTEDGFFPNLEDEFLGSRSSPDSRMVLLTLGHYGTGGHVYVVNSDGSNMREIPVATSIGSPLPDAVSPDGRYVLYTTNLNGGAGPLLGSGDSFTLCAATADGIMAQEFIDMADGYSWSR